MNFDRFRVQTFIEEDLGCKDIKEWNSYLEQFKSFKVNSTNKENLLSALKDDCADLYFNGVLSLAESINGLYNNRHSWSVIKIYYAVFYLLKCSHGTNKIAFLKNKGIYTLKIDDNELPIKRDKKKYKSVEVSGDHKTTIATYVQFYESSDILLSNNIDGLNVFNWLMNLRDQVNYRNRSFTEPTNQHFYASLFDKSKLIAQIETYINDEDFVYCFDSDHAALAAPLKLLEKVKNELKSFRGQTYLNSDKKMEIEKILSSVKFTKSAKIRELFDI